MSDSKRLDKHAVIKLIRTAVTDGMVVYTDHASERMFERYISRSMVDKCLLVGVANKPLVYNDEFDTYECRLSNYLAGLHYDVVAAISPSDPKVIIVTVIDTEE